ncbi:hypothetical protein FOZ63_027508, partial [Perkinsus olseni]
LLIEDSASLIVFNKKRLTVVATSSADLYPGLGLNKKRYRVSWVGACLRPNDAATVLAARQNRLEVNSEQTVVSVSTKPYALGEQLSPLGSLRITVRGQPRGEVVVPLQGDLGKSDQETKSSRENSARSATCELRVTEKPANDGVSMEARCWRVFPTNLPAFLRVNNLLARDGLGVGILDGRETLDVLATDAEVQRATYRRSERRRDSVCGRRSADEVIHDDQIAFRAPQATAARDKRIPDIRRELLKCLLPINDKDSDWPYCCRVVNFEISNGRVSSADAILNNSQNLVAHESRITALIEFETEKKDPRMLGALCSKFLSEGFFLSSMNFGISYPYYVEAAAMCRSNVARLFGIVCTSADDVSNRVIRLEPAIFKRTRELLGNHLHVALTYWRQLEKKLNELLNEQEIVKPERSNKERFMRERLSVVIHHDIRVEAVICGWSEPCPYDDDHTTRFSSTSANFPRTYES